MLAATSLPIESGLIPKDCEVGAPLIRCMIERGLEDAGRLVAPFLLAVPSDCYRCRSVPGRQRGLSVVRGLSPLRALRPLNLARLAMGDALHSAYAQIGAVLNVSSLAPETSPGARSRPRA